MNCIIEWNTLPLLAWEERFSRLRRSNLLQSYDYACVICPQKQQRARWGLVKIDGNEAGLVQILEAGLFKNLIHIIQLDRGPLWFEGYGNENHSQAFFSTFAKTFPARILRWRRILPEVQDNPAFQKAMIDLGYKRFSRPGYATIWIDLGKDNESLRAQLKGKWRNRLNAAEKAGFEIVWDWSTKSLPYLLSHYEADKIMKGFEGPSAHIIKTLAKRFAPKEKMLIGTALLNAEPVGIVLFFLHGASATYQTGWASEAGKKHSAHNVLLWQACEILKQKGIRDLDLGGVNDETAAGVKLFKEGLGGELIRYPGQYY